MSTVDYFESFVKPYLPEQVSYDDYCNFFNPNKIQTSVHLYGVQVPRKVGAGNALV